VSGDEYNLGTVPIIQCRAVVDGDYHHNFPMRAYDGWG